MSGVQSGRRGIEGAELWLARRGRPGGGRPERPGGGRPDRPGGPRRDRPTGPRKDRPGDRQPESDDFSERPPRNPETENE